MMDERLSSAEPPANEATVVHNLMPPKRPKLRECLCIYFAANHDDELDTNDVRLKFEMSDTVFANQVLGRMLRDGLLSVRLEPHRKGGRPRRVFRPGPVLLELIGKSDSGGVQ